jgi:hypothetical protein
MLNKNIMETDFFSLLNYSFRLFINPRKFNANYWWEYFCGQYGCEKADLKKKSLFKAEIQEIISDAAGEKREKEMWKMEIPELKNHLRKCYGISFREIENYTKNRGGEIERIESVFSSESALEKHGDKLLCAALLSLYTLEKEPAVVEEFCRDYGLISGDIDKDKISAEIARYLDDNDRKFLGTVLIYSDVFGLIEFICQIERGRCWKRDKEVSRRETRQKKAAALCRYYPAGAKFLGVPGEIAADGRRTRDDETFTEPLLITADPDNDICAGELNITRNPVGTLVFKFVFKENFPAPPHGLTLYLEGRGDPIQLKDGSYDPFFEKQIVKSEDINDIDDPGRIGEIYYKRLVITNSDGEADK